MEKEGPTLPVLSPSPNLLTWTRRESQEGRARERFSPHQFLAGKQTPFLTLTLAFEVTLTLHPSTLFFIQCVTRVVKHRGHSAELPSSGK